MFTISVPASSANIGPGFDSAGVAVSRYLTLQVTKADNWQFSHTTSVIPSVRNYKDHFIYKVANQVAGWHACTLSPAHVTMESDIPLARGLGSSASAIVAGIELANQLCSLELTEREKLDYAVKIEGHPDNVAACLIGGFVVTVKMGEEASFKKLPAIDTDLVVYIPNFELKTEDARKVLPDNLIMKDAATASGVSNLMISALLTGDYELAGKMMESDLFHESYRAKLIPNYFEIRSNARSLGAYGTVISGAGPTMISFVPNGKGKEIAMKMKQLLPDYEVEALELDENGLQVKVNINN
ncbi:homoserine kinase [Pseudogracilibacillus sp. SE30717A]|uniref:homoserine kinase n=1 Tax=Pseudogracilibacillus sp. SE30717A TaxID=3098293 RepID=UPI00300E4669